MPPLLTSEQALRFLADAGEVLSSSLDFAETLGRVARLAVPDLADWCAVFVAGPPGGELEITSGHPDPEIEALLREIRARRRQVEGASEARAVAESATPILAQDVRDWSGAELLPDERRIAARLVPTSYALVPLLARGRSIG